MGQAGHRKVGGRWGGSNSRSLDAGFSGYILVRHVVTRETTYGYTLAANLSVAARMLVECWCRR